MRSRVYAATLIGTDDSVIAQPADDDHLVAIGLKRLENGSHGIVAPTLARGMKVGQKHTVRRIHESHTWNRIRCSSDRRRQRRRHRIEKWQGHGSSETT